MNILIEGMNARSWGGVEVMVVAFFEQMKEYHFDIIIYSDSCSYIDKIPSSNTNIIYKLDKNYDEILKERNYDFVWSHISILDYNQHIKFFRYIKKNTNAKIIAHSHNASFGQDGKVGVISKVKRVYRKCRAVKNTILCNRLIDYAWACSDKAAKYIFGRKYKYTFIRNGIKTKQFIFNHKARQYFIEDINKKFNICMNNNSLIAINIGRLDYQKNQKFLIEFFSSVVRKNNNTYLFIVGDGELKNDLLKKVQDLNIQKNIIFLGLRNDVNFLLSAGDIFLLPSLYEGLPVVGVEAQCTGIKCILSDTITRQSNISGDVTFLPIANNIELWSNEVLNFTKNSPIRKEAYIEVEKQGFDIDVVVDDLRNKFNEMSNAKNKEVILK
ncbi:MAG: glycosyltransferase [Cetobacterium sp.]|nr:glycosyltransferase [Cetobacterium sp.]